LPVDKNLFPLKIFSLIFPIMLELTPAFGVNVPAMGGINLQNNFW
jgi:hypothetical protein